MRIKHIKSLMSEAMEVLLACELEVSHVEVGLYFDDREAKHRLKSQGKQSANRTGVTFQVSEEEYNRIASRHERACCPAVLFNLEHFTKMSGAVVNRSCYPGNGDVKVYSLRRLTSEMDEEIKEFTKSLLATSIA